MAIVPFIHANRLDAIHTAIGQSIFYSKFDRHKHAVPARTKRFSYFFPAQLFCPASKEYFIGPTNWTFTYSPRHMFYHYAMLRTFDTPRRITKENFVAPNGDEVKNTS